MTKDNRKCVALLSKTSNLIGLFVIIYDVMIMTNNLINCISKKTTKRFTFKNTL